MDEEYTRHENDCNEQIECGEITVHKRQSHSDVGTKRNYGGPTEARKKARTTSSAVIQPSNNESGNSNDDTGVPSSSSTADENANSTAAPSPSGTVGFTAPPPPSPAGSSPSPLGAAVSSTPAPSLDTATTPITCAIPSQSTAAIPVIPTNTNVFQDQFNMGGNATNGFNDIFTGYHHNGLDSLFFNFDFDDGATSNMTF